MSLLPNVLSSRREENRVTLELRVGEDLEYFAGHFPGLPILPGVVQVDWAVRLASRHFPIPAAGFRDLKGLKFSSPVVPGAELVLTLDWQADKSRLDFTYTGGGRRYASGQLLFSGNVAP